MRNALIALAVLLGLSVAPALGSVIILGTHTDHGIEPGRSLPSVRMAVDLSVASGYATMTFTNVSVAGESAVFKEITVDGRDNDTGAEILWNPDVLTWNDDVRYYVSSHPNGLPGYHNETADAHYEFQAMSSPVKYGLSVGQTFQVRFNTSLAEGSDMYDYFAAFGGGDDTAAYSIGFHAISASVVGGGSLSGVAIPEPGTLGLLAAGALALLARRRKN